MYELTEDLRKEYNDLFSSMVVRPERFAYVDGIIGSVIVSHKATLKLVEERTGVPYFIVGAIQTRESGLDYSRHLHNGDPLTARTVHVPAGRPKMGNPPFTWQASAIDALTMFGWNAHTDWSISGCLFLLESYNGFGYRNHGIHSPYLWSFSNHYARGKYVRDGVYDSNAVDMQIGTAVILRRMAEMGLASFPDLSDRKAPLEEISEYADVAMYDKDKLRVLQLQSLLNEAPGIWLMADGVAGPKTAAAYYRVTGRRLVGDVTQYTS